MGRVFISHSAKEPEASAALDELSAGLDHAGLTVLLDRERLKPGMEWRQEIHTWMALCHAAIVLFSPSALESEWVLKEATIVSWRHSLDPSFIFVPVVVPPTKRSDLEDHGFGPLGLNEIQFAPATALAEVVRRLGGLVNTDPETPMEAWVSRLTFVIGEVEKRNPKLLERAAEAADVDFKWVPGLSPGDMLARRLITAGPDVIESTIESFAKVLPSYEKWLSEMVEILVPAWVNPVAVADVPAVAGRAAPPRAIAVNGTETWVGRTYIQRAGCGTRLWLILEANNVEGEDEVEQVDRIVTEILEAARARMEMSSDVSLDRVLQRVDAFAQKGRRFFAIIPFGLTLTDGQVKTLEDRLPAFTFVLLTGLDTSATVIAASKATILQPKLNKGDEEQASLWIDSLRFLARTGA